MVRFISMNSFNAVAPWRPFVLLFVALTGLVASQGCSIWNFSAPPCAGDRNCQAGDRCSDGYCVPDERTDAGRSPDPGIDGGELGDGGALDGGALDAGPGQPDAGPGQPDAGIGDGGVGDGGVLAPCPSSSGCSFGAGLTANCDRFLVPEDTATNLDVLGNDCPGANGFGFAGITSWPTQGSLFVNSDGTLHYIPYPDAVTRSDTPDTFSYRIVDNSTDSSTSVATVYLDLIGSIDEVQGRTARYLVPIGGSLIDLPLPAYNPDSLALIWGAGDVDSEFALNLMNGTFRFYEVAGDNPSMPRVLTANLMVSSSHSGALVSQIEVEIAAFRWVGGTSTDWSDSNNWAPNGVPQIDDAVVIPMAVAYLPLLTADAEVGTLRIDEGASIDLFGNKLTVGGHLLLPTNNIGIQGALAGSDVTLIEGATGPKTADLRGQIGPAVIIARPVALAGATRLMGNVTLESADAIGASLDIGPYTLEIEGDLTHYMTLGDELFSMTDPRGRLAIFGNLTFDVNLMNTLNVPILDFSAGLVELAGNFTYQEIGTSTLFNIEARGTRFRFTNSGSPHVITFSDTSGYNTSPKFGPIELAANSTTTFGNRLVVNGYCNVEAESRLSSPLPVNNIDWVSHFSPGLPNVDAANTSIRGPVQLLRATQLASKLSITAGGASNPVSVSVGRFPLRIGDNNTTINKEVLSVTMDEEDDGLFMQTGSRVVVYGNSVFDGQNIAGNPNPPRLNGGRLDLHGSFTQVSAAGFAPIGTQVRFRGSSDKTISFVPEGLPGQTGPRFDALSIEGGGILLQSDVEVVGTLTIDAALLIVAANLLSVGSLLQTTGGESEGLFLNDAASNVLVAGAAEFNQAGVGTIDRFLNGTLTIRGDLLSTNTTAEAGFDMRCTHGCSGTDLWLGGGASVSVRLDAAGGSMALSRTFVTGGTVVIAAGSEVLVIGDFNLGNDDLQVEQGATLTVTDGNLVIEPGCTVIEDGTIDATVSGGGTCWMP